MDGFSIEFSGHFGGVLNISTVHQPEPGRHSGGEGHTVLDKRERGCACHIFPLSSRRTA